MNDLAPLHSFSVLKRSEHARRGVFMARSGPINTPAFMPVGTRGSVKGVDVERIAECGAEVMLVNTYHLWLRPGSRVVRDLGGIHAFTGWKGPILSDSGGFQIFSLKSIRKMSEEGVEFRSHIDGAKCFLSPERSLEIQEELGVDIAMVLDECPEGGLDYPIVEQSLDLTLRWAQRSRMARKDPTTAVFAITQGGTYPELRKRSIETLAAEPYEGFAIGGLSVGEKKEVMYEVLSYHVQQLPSEKIRYLMGVGTPEDIVQAVSEGVDLFDCVMPTRAGRFGRAFVSGDQPFINVKNKEHALIREPLDHCCRCLACRNYSRGYLHHLFKVGEMLGPQLLSIHNLTHYLTLMQEIREAIERGTFSSFYAETMQRWRSAGAVEDADPVHESQAT